MGTFDESELRNITDYAVSDVYFLHRKVPIVLMVIVPITTLFLIIFVVDFCWYIRRRRRIRQSRALGNNIVPFGSTLHKTTFMLMSPAMQIEQGNCGKWMTTFSKLSDNRRKPDSVFKESFDVQPTMSGKKASLRDMDESHNDLRDDLNIELSSPSQHLFQRVTTL